MLTHTHTYSYILIHIHIDLLDHIYRAKNEHVTSCVIDAEVVAYDRERQCLLPFQVLSTRKRKVDEGNVGDEKVKVHIHIHT